MKVDVWSSEDGHPVRDGEFSHCAGLASNALPESQSSVPAEVSRKGVSTQCTLLATRLKAQKERNTPHWYALRTTCLLYTSPSPRDIGLSRMPSSA